MPKNAKRASSRQDQGTTPPPRAGDEGVGVRGLGWITRFNTLLGLLGGLVVLLMMGHIVVDVIARAFFNAFLPDTLAIVQYVWMPSLVALGLGYALVRGEHLRVDLLTSPTGPRLQRIIEIVGMVSILVMAGALVWFGVESAQIAQQRGERAVGAHWVPIWPYRWVVLIGLASLALQAVAQLVHAIAAKNFVPTDEFGSAAIEKGRAPLLADVEVDGSVDKEVRTQ